MVASTPGAVSYSATIQPIFNSSCVSCHGVRGAEDINLTSYSATMGSRVVVPGRASNSKLYRSVSDAGDDRMPPGGNLSARQVQAIADWINQGARDN
ncbi:MAG: cytochrome c [Chloroflexi bacterium]|nr:cytochrome c [Chloroflexota bacterium]